MVRELVIIPVLNGFVVRAGCQQVVFNSPEQLADNVRDYYKNPEATEKKFIAGAVNKTIDCPPSTDMGHEVRREPCPPLQCCESEAPRSILRR